MVVCYFHFHHLTVTVVVTLPLTDHRTVLCAHGVCVVVGGGGGGGGLLECLDFLHHFPLRIVTIPLSNGMLWWDCVWQIWGHLSYEKWLFWLKHPTIAHFAVYCGTSLFVYHNYFLFLCILRTPPSTQHNCEACIVR